MHWMSIITALILALASAILVFVWGWKPWQTFLAVSSAALSTVLVIVTAMLLLSNGDSRKEFWRSLQVTFRQDLDGFLKMLGIKKR